MGVEEPGLTPKTMTSILMEEKVRQPGERFILMAGIHLKVPKEDEHITEGMVIRSSFKRNH